MGVTIVGVMLWSLAVVGTWATVSNVFLRWPHLLRRESRKLRFPVKHCSHRGGGGENTENTLRAFAHAWHRTETHLLELDVHLTKDERVVVFHDDNLFRLTGVNARIKDVDFNQLPKIIHNRPFNPHGHPSPSSSRTDSIATSRPTNGVDIEALDDDSIPTLESVFELFPTAPINIELKASSEVLLDKVYDLIVKYNRREFTIWGSKYEEFTKKCYAKDQTIPLFFSFKGILMLYVYYYTGLLPFLSLKESAFEPPLITKDFIVRSAAGAGLGCYPGAPFYRNWLVKFLATAMTSLFMSRTLVQHLQARGISVIFWTVNHEEGFKRAMEELGAEGVFTDFPTALSDYLQS